MMKTEGMATGLKVAGAGLFLAIAAWRLFSLAGADGPPRESLRVLVCQQCREMSFVDGEFIEQQYHESKVRPGGPDGMLFGCPSCEKVDAFFRDIDLIADRIVCPECGDEGPDQADAVVRMIKQQQMEIDGQGQMTFWCGGCDAFAAVLRRRDPPDPAGLPDPEP